MSRFTYGRCARCHRVVHPDERVPANPRDCKDSRRICLTCIEELRIEDDRTEADARFVEQLRAGRVLFPIPEE
jgi:hypothetical protein